MTTLLVMVQFVGQSAGLMYFRYRTMGKSDVPEGWRMPLFPLPCMFQIVIFSMIFITSDSIILWGSESPTLELSVIFLGCGCIMFLLRETARMSKIVDRMEAKVDALEKQALTNGGAVVA